MKSKRMVTSVLAVAALCFTSSVSVQAAPVEQYFGNWALHLPGGAGWLNLRMEERNDQRYLDGDILWHGGNYVPVANAFYVDGRIYVTRVHNRNRIVVDGEVQRRHTLTEALILNVEGDRLMGVRMMPSNDGLSVQSTEFTGSRIPPHSPAPDLSQLEFGDPIELFNGENLDGWTLTNPNQVNGWFVEDGLLVNDPSEDGVSYGNLRTVDEFEDFNLTLEVNVPPNGNSGVYLRGIYEIQVLDSYDRPPSMFSMGSIYGRTAPSESAEKPAGEWQTMDITLYDRHITVILNDVTIIDNEPVHGVTGGALWADEFRPGPIYLQGDHDAVKYRNMILRPIINN